MVDLLRKLLDLRTLLAEVSQLADGCYGLENFPEIAKMQELERKVFNKVNDWSKP